MSCTKIAAAAQQTFCFGDRSPSGNLSIDAIATEVRRVDASMKLNVMTKLNVLAACAAFVFVGAILLGAF